MANLTIVRNKNCGAALIEMAIILPLLLALTVGVIEYGWLFMKQTEIGDVTRYAARQAALPNATNASVNASITTAMASYQKLATSGYSVTLTPGDVSAVATGQPVTVKITVPYATTNADVVNAPVTLLNLPFIPVPANLYESVTMAKEGP
jgi:Flp pilus assembly protein TadG